MTLAWSLVVLGSLIWLVVIWLWLGGPRWLRLWLSLLVPVWSLVPAPVEGYPGELAPAAIVAVYELLFVEDGNPGAAVAAIVVGTLLLSIAVLAVHFAARFLARRGMVLNFKPSSWNPRTMKVFRE